MHKISRFRRIRWKIIFAIDRWLEEIFLPISSRTLEKYLVDYKERLWHISGEPNTTQLELPIELQPLINTFHTDLIETSFGDIEIKWI